MEPDLGECRFQGTVDIDLEIDQATREIVLHGADLEIKEAKEGSRTLKVRPEPARERLALLSDEPLGPGSATVHLSFAGTLSEKMRGFYRSTYTVAGGAPRILATTQFESTSARRSFPCFDEPALKATFQVTLVIPSDRQAVSNMPVEREGPASGGRRRLEFATTPLMSTYLLAYAVGEFEHLEAETKDGVKVRVYTTPGKTALGQFALETACRGLEFFSDYYGLPYRLALPKCDLLAIPDFEFGAMENWGAITFRETALFVDPEKSSIPQRRRVAEVVLHELAHQWFGNLVTPEWWSFLWLNESFATFMAYKATSALFPEWNIWEEYLAQITSAGRSLDSLRSSHPVEVVVRDPSEVDQIFDAISYNKGGSVLRMLQEAIGPDVFQKGIRRYLQRHAYACATTDDLWKALGEETGGDVTAMMDGWTRKTGLPVVTVVEDGARIRVRQERFLLDRDPDARAAADPALWDIPLFPRDASGTRRPGRLATREGEVAGGFIKLNADQAGFFLVHYSERGRKALAQAVESKALSALDRYGVQEDAYALMRAGYLPVGGFLELSGAYRDEENNHVWAGVADGLGALADIFVGDPAAPRLEAWARDLVGPTARKVGWEERPGEPENRKLLRATVLGAAVRFGDPETVREVQSRFAEARKNLGRVAPNLRSIILMGAARHGGDPVFEALTQLHESVELPELKVQLLRALGAFRNPEPLGRAFDYAISSKVRPQDAMYVLSATPVEAKPRAWALLKARWAEIHRRYGSSGMIGHWITSGASGIPTLEHADEVESFYKEHPTPYATERIKQTLEGIRARARFRLRNQSALAAYFRA
jgi:aminopeptidase N